MNKKGFTLIELLIVITIIGILSVALLPSLLGAPAKARDTQRKTTLSDIGALVFTAHAGNHSGLLALTDPTPMTDEAGSPFIDILLRKHFKESFPKDPIGDVDFTGAVTSRYYYYVPDPGGTGNYLFGVYSKLENSSGNIVCENIFNDNAAEVNAQGADCLGVLY